MDILSITPDDFLDGIYDSNVATYIATSNGLGVILAIIIQYLSGSKVENLRNFQAPNMRIPSGGKNGMLM